MSQEVLCGPRLRGTALLASERTATDALGELWSNLHFHIVARDAHLIGGDVLLGRKRSNLPRLDVEVGAVPGAFDLVVLDTPQAQRSTHVSARVVDGVNLPVQVEQGDPFTLDLDVGAIVLGKLKSLGGFDEPAHDGPPFGRIPDDFKGTPTGIVDTRDQIGRASCRERV